MSSIQATAVRGASWTIAAAMATRALGLVTSVAVTHYVKPDALGDVGAAAIFVMSAQIVSTIGIGQYLIATPDRSRENTFHVTVLNFALGFVAVAALLAVAGPAGRFLKVAGTKQYLPWLLVGFAIERVIYIPERLLIRSMSFRRIALARTLGDLVSFATTLALAVLGWGGWSLVAGNVTRSLARAATMMPVVPLAEWLTPTKLQRAIYERLVRFGLPIAGQTMVQNISSRWDNLAFSYLFGAAAMARYNVAYTLADLPADQVGEQIAEVLLPSFASMSTKERDAAVVEVTGLTALLIFPLSIGLGAVAPTVIATILSPEWSDVGGMLTILAALSVVRPLAWQANAYFIAAGTPRTGFLIDLAKLVVLFSAIFGFAPLGQLWVCGAVGLAFGVALLLAWWVIARQVQRRVLEFVLECLPALAACAVMTAGVLGARWAMSKTGIHLRGVGLTVEVLAGAVAYLAALPVVARKSAGKLLALVKGARRGRARRTSDAPAT